MRAMFFHNGIVTSDSEEESAFIELNISITTRMDRDMVEAVRVAIDDAEKMEQSKVANCAESVPHLWKCDSW